MNSYPSEFLTQLGPVMFVAGLDVPPVTPQSDTETSEDDRILGKRLQTDAFVLLVKRLRDVLLEKSTKKGTVWVGDTERSGPAFRIVLVDKSLRFPPQKASGQEAHSPLSPLTHTSPLHPDGLIAPIWVRKHTELLPAVFVLFLRLYESGVRPQTTPTSPLHNPVRNEEEEARREEERRRDAEMSAEIAARKRVCSERGVKLTVVLMASRRMLDDPNLDSRLTYIRRQSALDSRAALFVLSPVSPSELQDFVKSLQSALHDAALDYYLNHSKRVRRKRTKHASNLTSGINSTYGRGGGHIAPVSAGYSPRPPVQPLRPQGWLVRYEYKMACFAEFRGEEEVARKHFQTSWEMLVDMFGSTAVLPPRTKRWAEAKVLADCVSVKIIKFYLYRAEHSRALEHFNAHLIRFAEFSRGWGIGEETWEFWSWAARWNRILGELLEMATLSTLVIPTYLPNFPIRPATPPTPYQQPPQHTSLEPSHSPGVNPNSALQHPGFYYYAAAMCTERRLERFAVANDEAGTGPTPTNLTNERKVDHRVIILELYTKAYESFKKYSYGQGQSRLTFHVACRIAQAYHSSGKFDMAVRFFERIAKTYRRERWISMLLPILSMWYDSVRKLGDVDSRVKLLVEMMGYGPPDDFEEGQLEEELMAVLKSTSPSMSPFKLDFTDSLPIFESSVVFWKSEIGISEPAAFQLHLKAPRWASLSVLHFVSLRLEFSDSRPSVLIQNHLPPEHTDPPKVQLVDLGTIPGQITSDRDQVKADLRWCAGGTFVVAGTIASDYPTVLGISKVILTVMEASWTIEMMFNPVLPPTCSAAYPYWLSSLDPPSFLPLHREDTSTATVRHRPHLIDVALSHFTPAYLDEEYPITISINNKDDHDVNVVVDVLLQPTQDDAVNHISFGTGRSTSLIKGVQYGILGPGDTVEKTLILYSTGGAGDRVIDVSVQCEQSGTTPHSHTTGEDPTTPRPATDISESLYTLTIPTVPVFEIDSLATYRRPNESTTSSIVELADLRSYETSTLEAQAEATVRTTILIRGPWELSIETIKFLPAENLQIRLQNCSLDEEKNTFPLHCSRGDVYSMASHFVMYSDVAELDASVAFSSPGEYQITWSKMSTSTSPEALAVTRIPLPPLSPPLDGTAALLDLPATGKLHEPLTVTLSLRNRHPWRTANLHFQTESSDHFVVSGLRSGSVPVMLAGSDDQITFNLIPISCGTVQLPTLKIQDRRKASTTPAGDEIAELDEKVDVGDARLEERKENGEEVRLMVLLRGEDGVNRLRRVDADGLHIFISPS